jgi:RimJ/RimL family protein N-acetyltransferase
LFVEALHNIAPLGVVQMYRLTGNHGWAYYREFFPEECSRTLHVFEATALFLDHLFARYPIRKLYAEILAYNEQAVGKLKQAGFREEMRLKGDAWYGKTYVDYVYLGIFREEWADRRLAYLADLAALGLQKNV